MSTVGPASIGALNQRVALEVAVREPDGGGGVIVTWTEIARLWACVRPMSGEERLRADQVTGRVTHSIVIRYRAGITPAMRFRWGERVLAIVAVLDTGRYRRLRCLCEERDL